MAWLTCVFLGLVQGLCEFLPVSSSGHLRLLEGVLALPAGVGKLTMEVVLHAGTVVAVIVWLRADLLALAAALPRLPAALLALVRGAPAPARDAGGEAAARSLAVTCVACVPTVVVALALKKAGVEELGATAVALALIGSGLLNLTVRGRADEPPPGPPGAGLTLGRALFVGLVQGVAALPGLSRSASTIAAGVAAGLHPLEAARFSFLMAVPVVGGAALLEGRHLVDGTAAAGAVAPVALGAVVACFTGLVALRWLMSLIRADRFRWFAWYCFGVAALVLGARLLGGGA